MNNELKQCINELQETQSSSSIGQALREYLQLVKAIAKDFTDDTTVEELRTECPELDFMDDDELEDILALAIGCRNRPKKEDGEEELNTFRLNESKIFPDGVELRHVMGYSLKHSAGNPAELTLTLEVNVNQVELELVK